MDDFYLPDECWEHVLTFLDDNDNRDQHLKSVSVVSKRFLSITNRLRRSLTICKQLYPILPAIFHRFPNLTCVKCSYIDYINVTDLCLIADCFPLLEELNLNSIAEFHGNMLNGIETLSLALSKLRKINLSNHTYMNDQSLFHLFNNCKLLEEVIIFGCSLITNAGIASALSVRPTLRSISLTSYVANRTTLLAILRNGSSLSDINMKYQRPRFRNRNNNADNSYSSMNFVVSPQLKSLCLARNEWLNDETIIMFASIFPNLQLLDLSYCYRISESICQVLRTSSKIRHLNLNNCSRVNLRGLNFEVPKLEVLNLSHTGVDNESIITFASSFPNLQELDLSHCNQISEGICQLLRTSSKIRHLNLMHCSEVKLHGLNFEIPKLEVLNLSYTTTNDKELYLISKSCRGLLQLLLENCNLVTGSGVDHVVENCTQLREINLRRCYNAVHNYCCVNDKFKSIFEKDSWSISMIKRVNFS